VRPRRQCRLDAEAFGAVESGERKAAAASEIKHGVVRSTVALELPELEFASGLTDGELLRPVSLIVMAGSRFAPPSE
jgi:hypothetical protein